MAESVCSEGSIEQQTEVQRCRLHHAVLMYVQCQQALALLASRALIVQICTGDLPGTSVVHSSFQF